MNKKMQAGAKASVGERVRIRMEPDLEKRAVIDAAGADAGVEGRPAAAEVVCGAEPLDAQGDWRLGHAAEERRIPRKTRRTNGGAAAACVGGGDGDAADLAGGFSTATAGAQGLGGDDALQRRNHLLGIFYYQSADARERRAAKAVEEALRGARKRTEK